MSIYPAWDDPYEEPSPEVPKIKTPVTNPGPKFRIEQVSQEGEGHAFKVEDLFSEIQRENERVVAKYRGRVEEKSRANAVWETWIDKQHDLLWREAERTDPVAYPSSTKYLQDYRRISKADPSILNYLGDAIASKDEESAAHFAKTLSLLAARTQDEYEEIDRGVVQEFLELARAIYNLVIDTYDHYMKDA